MRGARGGKARVMPLAVPLEAVHIGDADGLLRLLNVGFDRQLHRGDRLAERKVWDGPILPRSEQVTQAGEQSIDAAQ